MATALVAAAAIALGHAIQIKSGFYAPAALAWLTLSLACSAAAVLRRDHSDDWDALVNLLLLAGILWQLSVVAQAPPGMALETRHFRPFHVWAAAAAAVAVAGMLPYAAARAAWFPVLAAIQTGLAVWVLRWSPSPKIDVIAVTNAALRALLHMQSPYAITFENIYGAGSAFYAPGAEANGRVLFGYPYPPASLVMAVPGYLVGDYRYASLAALLLAAVLIACTVRTQRSRLAAALLLTTPRIFFVLEQGWSEPMALLLVALLVLTMVRRPGSVAPLAGLVMGSKQYLVLAAVPLWRYAAGRSVPPWRTIAVAVAVAGAAAVPFLLWTPRAFLDSVVLLQAREPFRQDSLSYLTWISRQGWPPPSSVWTAAAAAAALALVASRRGSGNAFSFAASLAFILLGTFAFGKKAFCNYYFLVVGVMCCAVAASESATMANKRRSIHEPAVRPRP